MAASSKINNVFSIIEGFDTIDVDTQEKVREAFKTGSIDKTWNGVSWQISDVLIGTCLIWT